MTDDEKSGGETMVSFKGAHFPKEIILACVRWYLSYPLSYRHVEELMQERGVSVDHATVNRWVQKYSPPLWSVRESCPRIWTSYLAKFREHSPFRHAGSDVRKPIPIP